MAQALQMGDEGHNRNRAATSLLFRDLAPALVRRGMPPRRLRVLDFIHGNDHFFLNLSMPTAKCSCSRGRGRCTSARSLTVMARNGTDFGIQLARRPATLVHGPGPDVRRALLPRLSARRTPTPTSATAPSPRPTGLGGFAMAAAPAIVQFVGGTAEDALGYDAGRWDGSPSGATRHWAIPALDFRGTPTGIDLPQGRGA